MTGCYTILLVNYDLGMMRDKSVLKMKEDSEKVAVTSPTRCHKVCECLS